MSSQAKVILLVDSDPKGRRVLEVSLRKAGYTCVSADDGASGLRAVQEQAPDLILADTQLADGSGFEFCRQVKQVEDLEEVPFIFLTQSHDMADKLQGYELGVDDYLAKPVFVKEVLARIELLLERRAKALLAEAGAQAVEGSLRSFSLTDIFQTLEDGGKTGALRVQMGAAKGTVYFEDGEPVDARAGALVGEEAVYRMLGWADGDYTIKYITELRRARRIEGTFTDLVVEGLQRHEQVELLMGGLGGAGRVFRLDFARVAEVADDLPGEAEDIVNLFDGRRSVGDVVLESSVGDLAALQIIGRLRDEGLIAPVAGAPSDDDDDFEALGAAAPARKAANLGAWLSGEHSVVRRESAEELARIEAERLAAEAREAAKRAEEERLRAELENLRQARESEAERAREAAERQRALERQERELELRLSSGDLLPITGEVSAVHQAVAPARSSHAAPPPIPVDAEGPELVRARADLAALDRSIAEERGRLEAARARAEAQAELVSERERLHREAQVRTAELDRVRQQQREFEAEHKRLREQYEQMQAELKSQRDYLDTELQAARARETAVEVRRSAEEEARLAAIEEARRQELEAQRAERIAEEARREREALARAAREEEEDRRRAAERIAIAELERVREEALRAERAQRAVATPPAVPAPSPASAAIAAALADADEDGEAQTRGAGPTLPEEKGESRSLELEAAMTPQPVIVASATASGAPAGSEEFEGDGVSVGGAAGHAEAEADDDAAADDDERGEEPSARSYPRNEQSGIGDYGFFGRGEEDLYDSLYQEGGAPNERRLPMMVALLITGLVLAAALVAISAGGRGEREGEGTVAAEGDGQARISDGADLGSGAAVGEAPVAAPAEESVAGTGVPNVEDAPDEPAPPVTAEGSAAGVVEVAILAAEGSGGAAAALQGAVEASDGEVDAALDEALEAAEEAQVALARRDVEGMESAVEGAQSAVETPAAPEETPEEREARRAAREARRAERAAAAAASGGRDERPARGDDDDEDAPAPVAARAEPDDGEVTEALERARREYDSGDFGDAAELLRGVVEAQPRNGDALFMLGSSLYEQGDEREAVRYLERATRINRRNAEAFLLLGSAQQVIQDFSGARAAYEQYLELEPNGSMAEEIRQILDQQL